MESTVLFKVTYGETLRRFSGHVNEAGQLKLNIGGLREKVLDLFNFAADADLTLTYIDEDGDIVTLADDEDLCDAVRQSLKPLRINVKLNSEKGGRLGSTPMSSPRVQHLFLNLDSKVSEILRSVPEPFREALSKTNEQVDLVNSTSAVDVLKSVLEPLHDAVSKFPLNPPKASSSTGLAEIVDGYSKLGHSVVNMVSEIVTSVESRLSSMQNQTSQSKMPVSTTKETEASRYDWATLQVMRNAEFREPTCRSSQKQEPVNNTDGLFPTSGSLNLNAGLPGNSNVQFGSVSSGLAGDNTTGASLSAGTRHSKANSATNLGGNTSTRFPSFNFGNECPFSGMQVTNDSAVPHTDYGSCVKPFRRIRNDCNPMGGFFHLGVSCDGCGVYPIAGPRFKSKVKEDYDLCSICFSEMGNDSNYITMGLPVASKQLFSSEKLHDPLFSQMQHTWIPHQEPAHLLRSPPKLDSRFIGDVNVMDGTIMAPSTPFTKIWRMRNNGTIVWPQRTQLVWIGGNKLRAALSVELQILANGLPVDNELEISVNFTAPELPGRYASYWRLASPSGQRFGQRIWVDIRVDASLKDSLCHSFQGLSLNLNLPPVDSGITHPESMQGNIEPVEVEASLAHPVSSNGVSSNGATVLLEPLVDACSTNKQELNFPINDTMLVGGECSSTVRPEASTPVSFPITQIVSAVSSHEPSSSTAVPAVDQGSVDNNDVEQTLLTELEAMGFRQVDLSKEILRLNDYDLEKSLGDLCGVAEWDPIFEELQEMGFCDKETNKRLLKKNNGSIKRVVMDLITGEKE